MLMKYAIITGPTASGKSMMAIEIAPSLNAEIVSADSMMVYRGMDIGTAKPDIKIREKIPHHLIDILEPDKTFDAGTFSKMAMDCIISITKKGCTPLVVGGTGLYLRALTRGLIKTPPRNEKLRESLTEIAKEKGIDSLYEKLLSVDPESASKISKNDLVRIIRAIEIYESTGIPASLLRKSHGFNRKKGEYLYLVIDIPSEELKKRIRSRAEWMIKNGLIEEVETLLKKGYNEETKGMKGLGYRHVLKLLRGEITIKELPDEIYKDTWHFARHQINWFKSERDAIFTKPDNEFIRKKIEEFFSR